MKIGKYVVGALVMVVFLLYLTALWIPAKAQTPTNGITNLDAFAYESITVSTAVKTLTAATYAPANVISAKAVLITVEDQPIRYTFDGTTPDATDKGHMVAAGGVISLTGINNIMDFKVIRQASSDSKLKVTYLH